MKNWFNHKLLSASILCVICGVIIIPSAGAMIHLEGDNVARVTFSELDLSQQEGVETLYQRLKIATRMVCGTNDNRTRSLSTRHAAKKCYNKALDDSVRSIGNPRLDALHNG